MKILNFGSLNIDYVYNVAEIVRPGETISSTKMERFCGGKGLNQSVALAKAGAQVYHAGCIGRDGQFLLDALNSAHVHTEFVEEKDMPTGHAIIQVNKNGQNSILLFGGSNQAISKEQIETVLSQFDSGDWILLQNEINGLDCIIREANARKLKIAFNPSPIDEKIRKLPLELISTFFVNEIEGNEITGKNSPDEICEEFRKRFPKASVILTLGVNGALYADGTSRFYQPVIPSKVVDTTAAGDTFTGYFLAEIMNGGSYDTALKAATAASSIAVSRKGAMPSIPEKKQVLELLSKQL